MSPVLSESAHWKHIWKTHEPGERKYWMCNKEKCKYACACIRVCKCVYVCFLRPSRGGKWRGAIIRPQITARTARDGLCRGPIVSSYDDKKKHKIHIEPGKRTKPQNHQMITEEAHQEWYSREIFHKLSGENNHRLKTETSDQSFCSFVEIISHFISVFEACYILTSLKFLKSSVFTYSVPQIHLYSLSIREAWLDPNFQASSLMWANLTCQMYISKIFH